MANVVTATARRRALNALVIAANTLKWALYTISYSTGQTTYGTTNESTGTGYTAGGQTATSVTNTTGTNKAYSSTANPSWTSSSFSAAWAVLYDSTASNVVIIEMDLGGSFTVSAGTFTVNLPTNAEASAMIQL